MLKIQRRIMPNFSQIKHFDYGTKIFIAMLPHSQRHYQDADILYN